MASRYVFQPGQLQFAQRFSANTGLDHNVVLAWLYNEENGTAAWDYQRSNFHDWLNVGVTDSGSYGTRDPRWRDPVSAADLTAEWMRGVKVPGYAYGPSASGIRKIGLTAGASADTQLSAIQSSGWASGGESAMRSIYAALSGGHGSIGGAIGGAAGDVGGAIAGAAGDVGGAIGDAAGFLNPVKWVKDLTDWITGYALTGAMYAGLILIAVALFLIGVLRMLGIRVGSAMQTLPGRAAVAA